MSWRSAYLCGEGGGGEERGTERESRGAGGRCCVIVESLKIVIISQASEIRLYLDHKCISV